MSRREASLPGNFRAGALLFECQANISRSKEGVNLTLDHNGHVATHLLVCKCRSHNTFRLAYIGISLEQ